MKNIIKKIKNILSILKKNQAKYVLYTISFVLPIILLLPFRNLKPFDILLLSLLSFMCYVNMCLFEKVCIIPSSKDACNPQIEEIDLLESLTIGLISFIILFLLNRFYKSIISFLYKDK